MWKDLNIDSQSKISNFFQNYVFGIHAAENNGLTGEIPEMNSLQRLEYLNLGKSLILIGMKSRMDFAAI